MRNNTGVLGYETCNFKCTGTLEYRRISEYFRLIHGSPAKASFLRMNTAVRNKFVVCPRLIPVLIDGTTHIPETRHLQHMTINCVCGEYIQQPSVFLNTIIKLHTNACIGCPDNRCLQAQRVSFVIVHMNTQIQHIIRRDLPGATFDEGAVEADISGLGTTQVFVGSVYIDVEIKWFADTASFVIVHCMYPYTLYSLFILRSHDSLV